MIGILTRSSSVIPQHGGIWNLSVAPGEHLCFSDADKLISKIGMEQTLKIQQGLEIAVAKQSTSLWPVSYKINDTDQRW